MTSQSQPAKIEVFVNGQPVVRAFVAEELAITESRSELRINARRWEASMAQLPDNPGLAGVPTGTALDGYFGVQP